MKLRVSKNAQESSQLGKTAASPVHLVADTDPARALSVHDPRRHNHPRLIEFAGLTTSNLDQAVYEIAVGHKDMAVFRSALSKESCVAAVERLKNHHLKEVYEVAEDVGRIGLSLFETQFGEHLNARYWADAESSRHEVRRVFRKHGSPIDLLRAMCDEMKSFNGARLYRQEDIPAFIGLMRYLDDGAAIKAHIDHAGWDVPHNLEAQQIDCQVAANFYLNMPAVGGAVTVYNKRFSKLEYDANLVAEEYCLSQAALPPAKVTYKPNVGDLVLFNAMKPHEVEETDGETRYTASCFIGVKRDRSIVMFS